MRASVGAAAGVVSLGLSLVVSVGCQNGNPARPSPPLAGSSWMRITGSTQLNKPSDTSQLTVTLISPDGTTKDATGAATWTVVPSIISVRGGLLTAVRYGHCTITIAASGLTQSTPCRVLPEGMYLLQGRVMGSVGPLAGVHVDITQATGDSTVVTGTDGSFVTPAAGPVTIRVQEFGYEDVVRELTVGRDEALDIALSSKPGGPGDPRGTYTMKFMASPSCALPPEAMQRTYTALIETGASINRPEDLIVRLIGANFVGWGNEPGFTGMRDGGAVRFSITDDIFDAAYALIERIGGTMDLSYAGTATGTISEKSIITVFSGSLVVSEVSRYNVIAQCTASDHRLELMR